MLRFRCDDVEAVDDPACAPRLDELCKVTLVPWSQLRTEGPAREVCIWSPIEIGRPPQEQHSRWWQPVSAQRTPSWEEAERLADAMGLSVDVCKWALERTGNSPDDAAGLLLEQRNN